LLIDYDRLFKEPWTLDTYENHPQTDDQEDEERDPEQKTINDADESSPLGSVVGLFVERLLATSYLQPTVTNVQPFNIGLIRLF